MLLSDLNETGAFLTDASRQSDLGMYADRIIAIDIRAESKDAKSILKMFINSFCIIFEF